jgi:hypothetical protein
MAFELKKKNSNSLPHALCSLPFAMWKLKENIEILAIAIRL